VSGGALQVVSTAANVNKGDEAYTENHIGHRGSHIPEAVSSVKSINAVGDVVNVTEAYTEESQW
jgi:hypothetical protein